MAGSARLRWCRVGVSRARTEDSCEVGRGTPALGRLVGFARAQLEDQRVDLPSTSASRMSLPTALLLQTVHAPELAIPITGSGVLLLASRMLALRSAEELDIPRYHHVSRPTPPMRNGSEYRASTSCHRRWRRVQCCKWHRPRRWGHGMLARPQRWQRGAISAAQLLLACHRPASCE